MLDISGQLLRRARTHRATCKPTGLVFAAMLFVAGSSLFCGSARGNAPHRVESGQTLSHIAHQYAVSVATLEKVNRIRDHHALKPGQTLWIPGDKSPPQPSRPKKNASRNKSITVEFYRISQNRRLKVPLVNAKGIVSKQGRVALASLMRPRNMSLLSSKARRIVRNQLPHPRLAALLAKISQHFQGKTLHIISGFRRPGGHTHKTSRHVTGRAIDFRIPGISNIALRDYCRTLANVGVGFYPRNTFVHLDVRDKNAYWVDLSRTGEAPRYVSEDHLKEKRGVTSTVGTQERKIMDRIMNQQTAQGMDDESEDSAAIENDEIMPAPTTTDKATPNHRAQGR